jgi:hypothetical protein
LQARVSALGTLAAGAGAGADPTPPATGAALPAVGEDASEEEDAGDGGGSIIGCVLLLFKSGVGDGGAVADADGVVDDEVAAVLDEVEVEEVETGVAELGLDGERGCDVDDPPVPPPPPAPAPTDVVLVAVDDGGDIDHWPPARAGAWVDEMNWGACDRGWIVDLIDPVE